MLSQTLSSDLKIPVAHEVARQVRWVLTVCVVWVLGAAIPVAGSPSISLQAAVADARKLPSDQRQRTRYLTLYHLPERDHAEAAKVITFWCNSLSREADLTAPVNVQAGLLRVDLADYGWNAKVWDRLGEADPYFHAQVDVETFVIEKKWFDAGTEAGKPFAAGFYEVKVRAKVRRAAVAPWLDNSTAKELTELTGSGAPILRADWFLVQTAAQVNRVAGYYDFLGIKTREDYFKLIGLDAEAARRLGKEMAS